jgi:hypothetical protein
MRSPNGNSSETLRRWFRTGGKSNYHFTKSTRNKCSHKSKLSHLTCSWANILFRWSPWNLADTLSLLNRSWITGLVGWALRKNSSLPSFVVNQPMFSFSRYFPKQMLAATSGKENGEKRYRSGATLSDYVAPTPELSTLPSRETY